MSNPEAAPPASSDEPTFGYATTWQLEESLESLNLRLHDGVPLDLLLARGIGYRDWLFGAFPEAEPAAGSRAMELGSGVGWIMEAMLGRVDFGEIVGLDISENMIKRAQERFDDPRARFVLYDGLTMPFDTGYFDFVYSVAAMQHIEKHAAFLLFEEIHRLLAPGGHAVIHLLGVDHITDSPLSYHEECMNHVLNITEHWHHFYSFDELFVLFSDVIGVSDLDIVHDPENHSFLIHFTRDGAQKFRRPDLPDERYEARKSAVPESAPASPPPIPPNPDSLHALIARGLPESVKARLRPIIFGR